MRMLLRDFLFSLLAVRSPPYVYLPTMHTNGVVLLAVQAGVPNETINAIGVWYTLSRIAFGLAYVFIESEPLSFLRSLLWWSGKSACITALVLAGKRL